VAEGQEADLLHGVCNTTGVVWLPPTYQGFDERSDMTDDASDPGAGSGRGGALGTPSLSLDEAPPSADQEANWVVSGGGLAGPEDDEPPREAARHSPSSQAP